MLLVSVPVVDPEMEEESSQLDDQIYPFELRASIFELRALSFELRTSSFELLDGHPELRQLQGTDQVSQVDNISPESDSGEGHNLLSGKLHTFIFARTSNFLLSLKFLLS